MDINGYQWISMDIMFLQLETRPQLLYIMLGLLGCKQSSQPRDSQSAVDAALARSSHFPKEGAMLQGCANGSLGRSELRVVGELTVTCV